MKKVVCYSCCAGGYDDILQHNVVNPDWEYIFFTDNPDLIAQKHVGHWEIRPLVFNALTNVKNARWHKVNAHLLFPDYPVSLWVDANIKINSENVLKKVDQMIEENNSIYVPLHPDRKCIYEEAKVIIGQKYDLPKTVNAEMERLKKDKYPANNGLHETCILFRRHNEIKPALDLWWNMIEKYSKRDQLSFDYAMWKNQVKVVPFYDPYENHRTNGEFIFQYGQNHNGKLKNKQKKFKIFQKIKNPNGHRYIYFCGIRIFSYKRKARISLPNVYLFDENGEEKVSSLEQLPQNFMVYGNLSATNIVKIHKNLKCRRVLLNFFPDCSDSLCVLEDSKDTNGLDIEVVFQGGKENKLKIGQATEMNGTKIWLGNGSECYIGNDCLFSYDIVIRATDGHTIYDQKTGEIINIQKQPCIIGNHCWIGLRTIINKNTQIADNTIVGSGSVLTKKYEGSNCVIAGNPAKVIKEGVVFDARPLYNSVVLKDKKNENIL